MRTPSYKNWQDYAEMIMCMGTSYMDERRQQRFIRRSCAEQFAEDT